MKEVNYAEGFRASCETIMGEEELIRLFDSFVNEHGLWYEFKSWVEKQGYTVTELGFPDDEE